MENKQQNQSFARKNWKLVPIAMSMVFIIALAVYTYVSQPAMPNPSNVYQYMQNNFNSTFTAYPGETNITVFNSVIVLAGNPYENISAENVSFANFSDKTYIYFFGVEASGQSAVETYVLWNYLTSQKKSFPAYSNSFASAQASIPIIPQSYIIGNITSSNPVLVELVAPLSYQQAVSNNNLTNEEFVQKWLAYNVTTPEAYVFSYAGKGNLPQVDVVRTVGDKTIECNAFTPFAFILYNATSSSKFLNENMQSQTFGSLLPTTASMNENLNSLNGCVQTVESWKG